MALLKNVGVMCKSERRSGARFASRSLSHMNLLSVWAGPVGTECVMVGVLNKTGLELIGWEVVPCQGKPWGDSGSTFSTLEWEGRHHSLTTYCLFPQYSSYFLVEILGSCIRMSGLCRGFLNCNSVYIFSSTYFVFNWLFFFQFLRCVYTFQCVGHRHVHSCPIQSFLQFCVWTLPTFFSLLGIL